jgi:serine/threonine-protein kinase
MTEQRHQRVQALFDQAADLPSADQKALLDVCCADDPDLRARVEYLLTCDALLRATEAAPAWLDSPLVRTPPDSIASTDDEPARHERSAPAEEFKASTRGDALADALPGHLGRYELLEELGRGGMGAVLRAHDPDLRRDLAIKLLLPDQQQDPRALSRFTGEAQIGGQLQHPGIVPVYEVGRFADQQPYFTMKLVRGHTLTALLHERRDPGKDRARFEQIFEQVCQTIAYAHSRGVIHRDLKPSNIMVGAFGEVQVMDWGLAKVLNRAEETQPAGAVQTARSGDGSDKTTPGWVAGTPAYMAPEQAAGEPRRLDQRCDVFALGAILCEILTGQPPYGGAEDPNVLFKASRADLAGAFARLDACGADAELIRLVRSALAPEASDRPRDAEVLAAGVAAYRESMATRLRQAELAQAEARARAIEERKRRRLRLGLAALVLLTAFLAGGAWFWLERRREGYDRQALNALAQADLLHQQAQAGNDAAKWAETRAMVHRALDLLEEGTGLPVATERARDMLRVLDEAEADRRLLARADEAQFAKVKADVKGLGFALRGAVPLYSEAFTEYGMDAGAVTPEQAAARIGQRPAHVRQRIIGALDDWQSLLWDPGEASTARWVEAVLTAADPDPWRQRLRVARRKNDQPELQRLADEVDVGRQPPWTLMLLGIWLRNGSAPRQGLALMRRAQSQYPADFWVNFELAYQLGSDPDRTDDPVRFYRVAAALRPDNPLVRFLLANALTSRGEVDKAVTVLREAIALQPDMAVFHVNLGVCLAWLGERDAAIRAFRRTIDLDRDNMYAYTQLGIALADRGDRAGLNEVLDQVQQVIKRKPKESGVYSGLGDLLLRKNDLEGARAAYRRANDALGPDDFDAHFGLGGHLKDQRMFEEALAVFRHCQDLAAKTKRPDLSERAAQAARETEPLQLRAPGRAHASRREWGQAARCYAQLLDRDKAPNAEVCFEHAVVLLLSGDREGYRNACARMVERCSEDRGFLAYLTARACTLSPGPPEEIARAGQLAERELKASPRASWLLTEQAALHYRADRFDRALPLLEQSLKADKKPGSNVLNWLWLALTCQKLGQTAQARSWLERATKCLDQFPEGLPAGAEYNLGFHLHNWLEAHVLRREAEACMGEHTMRPVTEKSK